MRVRNAERQHRRAEEPPEPLLAPGPGGRGDFDPRPPVAKIVPLSATNDFSAEELELAADGIISLPEKELDIDAFLALPRPDVPLEVAAQAVADDREESETRILGQ